VTGLTATLLTYLALYGLVGWGLGGIRLWGIGWADALTDALGGAAVFVITLLLFPAVVTLVLGVLQDDIARAVDARHYPDLPPPRRQSLPWIAWGCLRFCAVAVAINLLALPLYLLLLFVGFGAVLYYLVNGYLLSRDYFEMAAWRRLDPAETDRLRRRHRLRLWGLGLVLAVLSSVPVINLAAPLIATAAMIHEVEQLRRP